MRKYLLTVMIGEMDCVEEEYDTKQECFDRLTEMFNDGADVRGAEIHNQFA
jgi:hypothetical protein